MPSTNPAIFVRLPRPMYERIVELASKDGRSLSNFVEHTLRRLVTPDLELVFKPRRVKRRPSRAAEGRRARPK